MSLGETLRRVVLTEFKADTSQAAREVDRLIDKHQKLKNAVEATVKEQAAHFDQIVLDVSRSSQTAEKEVDLFTTKTKEAEQATKKWTEGSKSSLESALGAYAKTALAIGAVGAAAHLAGDAIKSYGEHARLESSLVGVSVEELSKEFSGLISNHDILTMAAQTQRGVFRLNQEEMETLGKAALALRSRGLSLEESLKKLTDAAVKGKVEGLDDLGLSIEKGESHAESLKNMMTELNKVIAESGSQTNTAADDVQRLAIAWDNTTESVKHFGASAILALSEPLAIVREIQENIERQKEIFQGKGKSFNEVYGALTGAAAARYKQKSAAQLQAEARENTKLIEFDEDDDPRKTLEKQHKAERERLKKLANEWTKSVTDALLLQLEDDDALNRANAIRPVGGYSLPETPGMGGIDTGEMFVKLQAQNEAMNAKAYGAFRGREQQSFLESAFGKLEDFNAYAQAFQMLSGAVSAGLGAWIDGSMSAGQAIKKFLADSLKALAQSMAVEALKHGAYAIGSLAFGDLRGASTHGAAAAAFGAGAAAAAVAAKSLGGSGASAPGASGGSSGSASGSSGTGRNAANDLVERRQEQKDSRPVIVMIGSEFGEDSMRTRSIKAREAVDRALRERDE